MKRVLFLLLCFVFFMSGPGYSKALQESSSPENKFRVLDISERTIEGGPVIAVLFSEPLDPGTRHDSHLRISDSHKMLKSAWVLTDDHRSLYFPHVEPETEYSVSVLKTLASASGNTLKSRESRSVKTRSIKPVVSFASDGILLPENLVKGLPVITVNIKTVDMEFFRMNDKGVANFIDWNRSSGRKSYYRLNDAKNFGEMVFSGRFDLDATKNKRVVRHIPIENIPELQKHGVYLAVMRQPGEYSYEYQTTCFLVTNIGLHARIYKNESLVFASNLKTGEPIPDAAIFLYDRKDNNMKKAGKTDEKGSCRIEGRVTGKFNYIYAKKDGHVGLLPLKIPALDMSNFKFGSRRQQQREMFVYSPRDMYRPGETAIVSAFLRDYDGKPVTAMPIRAKLFRPDGRLAKDFVWYASNNAIKGMNYFQTDILFPKNGQTGLWKLELRDRPSSSVPFAKYDFHVEEFLPERMKLDLTSKSRQISSVSPLNIDVLGMYLYGAPAAGNTLGSRVRVNAARNISEKYKDFIFGRVEDETYNDQWDMDDIKLDKTGKAVLNIPNRWKRIKSPLSVRVVASLYETGGRPVTRSITHVIMPKDDLVGIRPLINGPYAEEGVVKIEVIKTGKDGGLKPAEGLFCDLEKLDRDYYWEFTDSGGWNHRYTEKKYKFLSDTINLDGKKPGIVSFPLEEGWYILKVKDPVTNLTTSTQFRVGYWWYDDSNQGTVARPDKVMMKLDKASYQPGDVIQLTVTPPHDGDARILVEGESLLWQEQMKVAASGTTVEIPVSAKWNSHNIYISTVVFRPADAKEKITPNRAVGLVHLPLDRSAQKLEVKIEAPEKTAPQQALTANLSLDSSNFSSDDDIYVTLAAVDVGILNITDFKTPDPFNWFFTSRRFGVSAYDIYHKVIEIIDGQMAKLRFGGDADVKGGKRPETKIKLLTLFRGPVKFDDNGQAQIKLYLPDFNGKIRLMAVAFGKSSYGSAEFDVTVAAPVVTQLAMPRFLAPDDETRLTLDVHNLSGQAQQLEIKLDSDGPLALADKTKNISLDDQEKKTLFFPATAVDNFGKATIRMNLVGEGINLKRDWELGIRPGYPGIVRKIRKVVKPEETFELPLDQVEDLMPETVDVAIKISPTIPLNIRHVVKGLVTYPYGCLEQTSSRAWPLLFATDDKIKQFGLDKITKEQRLERIEKAISRLLSMQQSSGGFSLWNRTGPEEAWLSVYVCDFLLNARDNGIKIPSQMIENAMSRLETYLKKGATLPGYFGSENSVPVQIAIRSYAGYVLSRVKRASLGSLRTLADQYADKCQSGLPLVHLGIALKTMGDHKRADKVIKAGIEKRRESRGYWGDYGSRVRDLAWTMALVLEHGLENEKGFASLILDLENEIGKRQWLSTQEKFSIFRAAMAINSRTGKMWKGKLTVSGNVNSLEKQGSYVSYWKPNEISGGLSFVSESSDLVFASAIITGYTKNAPLRDDRQISIRRNFYDTSGKPVDSTRFKVGELLMVHLVVKSKEEFIPDALIVDLLPAGFEIENQNLKHSVKLDDLKVAGGSVWKLKENAEILHEEFRDDRYVAAVVLNRNSACNLFYLVRMVSPGSFFWPPTMAESMYRPEIRGIGDTPPQVTIINKNQ